MTSTRTLHTVRAATSLATARPAYAAGLRGAIATVIPLVVDQLLGTGGGTWMSLAGFNVALADRGGPYRIRAATMSAVTLCCALGLMLGSLASSHIGIAIPLTFAVALAASLARVWGVAGASVATRVANCAFSCCSETTVAAALWSGRYRASKAPCSWWRRRH